MSRPTRIPGLPEQATDLFAQLQQEDLMPVPTMKAGVEAYRQAIAQQASRGLPANVELGDAVAHALQQLLGRVNHLTEEPALRVIHAAVRYFLIQDEGHGGDLASMTGLEDDARVVNAVVRYYGRDDLCVDVPERPPAPAAPAVATGRRQFAMPPPRR
jgi:hypothetical protein